MLVLSRKAGEKIVVPECELTVTVLEIAGGRARLGISAPADVAVHREEVWQRQCTDHAQVVRRQVRIRREPPDIQPGQRKESMPCLHGS